VSYLLTMHFDGARSITSVGAGIVFTYSLGKVVSFSYRLQFDCADNVAMHDALIEISRDIRIKALKVIGDSDLIVQQAKILCPDKNARLKKYGNIVWDTIKLFQSFSIYVVPREMSTHANAMAESTANFQPYRCFCRSTKHRSRCNGSVCCNFSALHRCFCRSTPDGSGV
jgi:hypothetical protein